MKTERKRLENKLDELWRTDGKSDAKCEVCETLPVSERVNYGVLHPHHIIGRKSRIARWDLRNRCWLCPTHHTLGSKNAQENQWGWFLNKFSDEDWMGQHRKEDKRYLEELSKIPFKKWTLEELREKIINFQKGQNEKR